MNLIRGMEGSEHSLVPQWLKSSGSVSRVTGIHNQVTSSPYSDNITYSGCQWSSIGKGSGLSRSYSSSERSQHDRDREKDIDYFFNMDKLFIGEYNHDHSDYTDKVFSNRFEKDLLHRSQSMNSGRWRETWSPRTTGDVSSPKRDHGKSDGVVTCVAGIMHKTVFDEEFPLLGAEDKHDSSELGSVFLSCSNTPSHSLTSASHEIPMTVGSSSVAVMMHQHTVSASTSSISPGTIGLSMAETLAQGPPRSHTPPQLSVSTQKLEELAHKQSRLLIPIMPSTPRSLVASPLEKSKVKTGQQQYPFSYSRSPSHSPRGAPTNSDIQKIRSGNSRHVNASQELNGVSSAVKDNLSPSRSRLVLSPIGATTSPPSRSSINNSNSTTSTWITLEKRPTFQTQSRSDFFKNLSRKSSSKTLCSDVCPNGMSCALNSLSEDSCVITENGSAASEPLKCSSNGEQQYSTNTVLYPDEEEIVFLRSLGWEESAGEDEGLTEEEIQDFYEKYMKLKPSLNILQSAHQNTAASPLDSSSGGCGGAPWGLRSSA